MRQAVWKNLTEKLTDRESFFSALHLFIVMSDTDQIIRQYCGDIKERLQACRSRSVALALKDRLCTELNDACTSSMIKNVLNVHVDRLIDEIFDADGKNKFLEKQ